MQAGFGDRLSSIDSRLSQVDAEFKEYLAKNGELPQGLTANARMMSIRDQFIQLTEDINTVLNQKSSDIKSTNAKELIKGLTPSEMEKTEFLMQKIQGLQLKISMDYLSPFLNQLESIGQQLNTVEEALKKNTGKDMSAIKEQFKKLSQDWKTVQYEFLFVVTWQYVIEKFYKVKERIDKVSESIKTDK